MVLSLFVCKCVLPQRVFSRSLSSQECSSEKCNAQRWILFYVILLHIGSLTPTRIQYILKIQRIQHPFAYGRFLIRKQQLTLINKREQTANRVILSITDHSKLDSILHYNCDSRLGGFSQEHRLHSHGFILIIKTLSQLPCERDSDRYPEYLIAYRQIQWPSSNRPVVSSIQPTSSTSLIKDNSRSSQSTISPYKHNSPKTVQRIYDSYESVPWDCGYSSRDNLAPTSSYEHSSTKNVQRIYDSYEYSSWRYSSRDNFAPTSSSTLSSIKNVQSNDKNYEYDYQYDNLSRYDSRYNPAEWPGPSSDNHGRRWRWWLWIGAALIVVYIYRRRLSK
ncbi:uncharacterized protein LOC116177849 isoform X2 [Photinus pyralis]|uniref:uncharacterized protein LOC116177849 isoform X2 n=1 Tax=Photinus pyralis TaxID=7054 RepID=UPI0012674390|nr:uncharacterized protein LOC116177849 isoform X2 [Photinus pyralis]